MNEYHLLLHNTKPNVFWFINIAKNLYSMKEQIGIDNNFRHWNYVKQFTNQYERIYNPKKMSPLNSLKSKILSRAFYKFYEIIYQYDLHKIIPLSTQNNQIYTLHLAEGPGGFIQAWNTARKNEISNRNNKEILYKNDNIYGITLADNKKTNIHGWSNGSVYFNNNNNITVDYGNDETGNLFHRNNINHILKKYENNKAMLITGDGGFDFSSDFSSQEINSFSLLFIQSYLAIKCQHIGGVFVLKVFDVFNISTIQLIHMISKMYSSYNIIKPNTSRPANSEKYIIFYGFREVLIQNYNNWDILLEQILNYELSENKEGYIYRISMNSVNADFLYDLQNKLKPLIEKQLINFTETLAMMDKIQNDGFTKEEINNIHNIQKQKRDEWLANNPIHNKFID
jgi:23S rRNA U2552 (ribose-2'-O)-methylase RlmE/FtsJ